MCGIVGYIEKNNSVDRDIILSMMKTLVHRGPDDSGFEILGNVALGHRRLSIIDLSSAGRQPMSDSEGKIWILLNGEFYNFPYYRKELLNKGYRFKSKTDTEVIIYMYIEYGFEKMLNLMNGMYAFCIYDAIKKKIYLVRDRMGIKPCYYALQGDLFLWGSELKALLKHPRMRGTIRPDGIKEYFSYMYIPDPHTIYEDVMKVMPGEYIEFDVSRFTFQRRKYWDVSFDTDYEKNEGAWLEELDTLMETSIKSRLISDVPFGAFLSGGIDSTFVVSYMSRIMTNPVTTFSIGFEEHEYSELPWARQVSKKFHTEHHEQTVLPDAMSLLPRLAFHYDEPFGDPSAVPTYYVSRLARDNVTVVLSGDGGDENFAGYPKYDVTLRLHKVRKSIPSAVRKSIVKGLSLLYPQDLKGKGLMDTLVGNNENIYHTKMLFFNENATKKLLKQDIAYNDVTDVFKPYFDKMMGAEFLSAMQYIDLMTYLPMDILTKVDRASMAVSLETRVPILDYRVVELAAKIPVSLQRMKNTKKYIMKKILKSKFQFDDRFLERGKRGFDIPIDKWFKGQLKGYAEENLLGSDVKVAKYLNQDYIANLIQKHSKGYRNYANLIWSVLIFEHWLRAWENPS